MFPTLSLLLLAATSVFAQEDGPVPPPNKDPRDPSAMRLTGKRFPFDQLPLQADTTPPTTVPEYRGPQSGYNNCQGRNTTADAMCQTLVVNSIDDFCFFAPPTPNSVGNAEHETVAFCTKPTHGARLMPEGTLTGVQFLRAPSYVAVVGFINMDKVNIVGDGGELDSGGQDMRGNPVGGLAYSNSLRTAGGKETQSTVWHQFIGSGMFCMKLCDDKSANPRGICRHTLDTYGCEINVPNSYTPDVFSSCDSDDQAPVQVGVTAVPASSNCVTYASTDLFGANAIALPAPTGTPAAPSASAAPTTTQPGATVPTPSAPASGNSVTRPGVSGSNSATVRPTTSRTSGSAPSDTPGDSASAVGASGLILTIAGLLALAVVA